MLHSGSIFHTVIIFLFYLKYLACLSLVWFMFFWCRHIMFYCFLPSKNNCNNMFVFMPWKQSWLAGSLSNLYKAWPVNLLYFLLGYDIYLNCMHVPASRVSMHAISSLTQIFLLFSVVALQYICLSVIVL